MPHASESEAPRLVSSPWSAPRRAGARAIGCRRRSRTSCPPRPIRDHSSSRSATSSPVRRASSSPRSRRSATPRSRRARGARTPAAEGPQLGDSMLLRRARGSPQVDGPREQVGGRVQREASDRHLRRSFCARRQPLGDAQRRAAHRCSASSSAWSSPTCASSSASATCSAGRAGARSQVVDEHLPHQRVRELEPTRPVGRLDEHALRDGPVPDRQALLHAARRRLGRTARSTSLPSPRTAAAARGCSRAGRPGAGARRR
jgi:hypothetical protein